jgi:hypothetical protein
MVELSNIDQDEPAEEDYGGESQEASENADD